MNIEALKSLSEEELDKLKKELIFTRLKSAKEVQAWIYLFFGIEFPMGVVYPTSTHGPADAIWRIYELFATGKSAEIPKVAMLASRDSFKCQKKGSILLTKKGFKNIEDISIG